MSRSPSDSGCLAVLSQPSKTIQNCFGATCSQYDVCAGENKATRTPRTRVSHCHVWFCPKIKDPCEHMLPHFISWLPSSKLTSMWKIQISRLFSRGFPMVFYLSMFVCSQVPGWFLSHQSFRAMGQKSHTPPPAPAPGLPGFWIAGSCAVEPEEPPTGGGNGCITGGLSLSLVRNQIGWDLWMFTHLT